MTDSLPVIQESLKLNPDALIELFVLDATAIDGDILYFYAGVGADSQPISFQGNVYSPIAMFAEGFAMTGRGEVPRPKIRIANLDGSISALCLQFDDLLDAKVIRRRTYARFLDGGINENDLAQTPDDVFFVERKTTETNEMVEFELGSVLDMDGIMLPRRQVTCNQCTALYRSADCTFTGDYVVADETDTPMSGTNTGEWNAATTYSAGQVCWRFIKNRRVYFQALVSGLVGEGTKPYRIGLWKTERCSLRLTGCKMRFGINAELPINSFPATRKGAA